MNLNRVSLTVSAGFISQFPKEPLPQIALAGRSNVGKSSLINTLLNRKSLARVSGAPGKTITVNFYNVDSHLYLVDLPGYGYARRSREEQALWSRLTDGYFSSNPQIDRLRLVAQLVDVRVGATEDDLMMLRYLAESGLPFILVATKADKLSKTELANKVAELSASLSLYFEKIGHPQEDLYIIPFSSVNRQGKDELWNAINRALRA